MSTALALAGVSAVLRDLLNDRFINGNVAGVLGSTVTVTTLPPDRIATDAAAETSQLNLFLLRVTPNLGWRNEALPARDAAGRNRLGNPPLALNLHYLISAYGAAELHAEILLGYAMQLLHENPVIPREAVRRALQPPVEAEMSLPQALRALSDSGLEDQIEQLRITPEYLNSEELSKFWTATKANFRPSAAFEVSVVLIQATEPARAPLPVLIRQATVVPDLVPAVPTLEAIAPAAGQPVAQLGTVIDLTGHHLDGTGREVHLINDRFEIDVARLAMATGGPGLLQFSLAVTEAALFPVGVYRVAARVQRPGELEPRETNQLAMTLAPEIIGLPQSVPVVGNSATITVNCRPEVQVGQTVGLVLGQQEFAPQPFPASTATLTFIIPEPPLGDHLARLRVDGIESPIIDRTGSPPKFLPGQRIAIVP
jgi:hypothetical protein